MSQKEKNEEKPICPVCGKDEDVQVVDELKLLRLYAEKKSQFQFFCIKCQEGFNKYHL